MFLWPIYQKLVTELYSDSDEELRADSESSTDTKLHEWLINLDHLFDLDKNEEFLGNESVSQSGQRIEMTIKKVDGQNF